MSVYSFLLIYSLKFLNNDFLVWGGFVPLFYFIYIKSKDKIPIKLELFVFSLVFMITFLFGFTNISPRLYGLIYLTLTVLMFLNLYLSYLSIRKNFYLPVLIWLVFEKFLIEFLPFYSTALFTANGFYIKQLASLFGTLGITFIIILFNLVITKFIIKKNNVWEIAVIFLIISLIFGYGHYYLKNSNFQHYNMKKVIIAQTKLDNSQKEYFFNGPLETKEYISFIDKQIPDKETDLIILPEVSIWQDTIKKMSNFFKNMPEVINKEIPKLAQKYDADILFGVRNNPKNKGDKLGNYLLYYDVEKEKYVYKYEKEMLIPAYETSFKNYFKGYFKNKSKEFKYKTLICYEGLFEPLIKNNLEQSKAIMVLSNNMLLGKNKLPNEMLKLYILRAISFNRNIVISDNWGYTVIINKNGQIINFLNKYERSTLIGNFKEIEKKSFYFKEGRFLWIIIFIVLSIILIWERGVKT